MIRAVLSDIAADSVRSTIAAKFHNTLAELIVETAARVGKQRVVLSGGCFQNRYLSERVISRLEAEGFHPYWHQRVPPNDGGIALGQIFAGPQAHQQKHREANVEMYTILFPRPRAARGRRKDGRSRIIPIGPLMCLGVPGKVIEIDGLAASGHLWGVKRKVRNSNGG